MAVLTLLDIAKLNGNDAMVGLIEENLNVAPEVTRLPSRTIKGTSYRTVVRTAYPTVGFRKANEGETASKSTFEQKLTECFILSSLITVDKAVALAYEEGVEVLKGIEAAGVLAAALQSVGRQIFYGSNTTYSGDADGFPGFLQCHDTTNMVVDAGGTTATTGSSVYLVRAGIQAASLVVGNGGQMQLSQWREETVSSVPSHVADMTAYVGLQCANSNKSIGRIKKLTADSGCGLTDAKLSSAWSKFPVGYPPTHIFCSRRSHMQLWQSRTVTLFGGPGPSKTSGNVELIAAPPTEFNGVPIIVTDSLSDVEALTL